MHTIQNPIGTILLLQLFVLLPIRMGVIEGKYGTLNVALKIPDRVMMAMRGYVSHYMFSIITVKTLIKFNTQCLTNFYY